MKHNLFSRFIGVLLAVVMLASLMSMPSLANTVSGEDLTAVTESGAAVESSLDEEETTTSDDTTGSTPAEDASEDTDTPDDVDTSDSKEPAGSADGENSGTGADTTAGQESDQDSTTDSDALENADENTDIDSDVNGDVPEEEKDGASADATTPEGDEAGLADDAGENDIAPNNAPSLLAARAYGQSDFNINCNDHSLPVYVTGLSEVPDNLQSINITFGEQLTKDQIISKSGLPTYVQQNGNYYYLSSVKVENTSNFNYISYGQYGGSKTGWYYNYTSNNKSHSDAANSITITYSQYTRLNRAKTADTSKTIQIDLFDYDKDLINQNRAFLFGNVEGSQNFNLWSGSVIRKFDREAPKFEAVYQDIVAPLADKVSDNASGKTLYYPQLNRDVTDSSESLAYLFDGTNVAGKTPRTGLNYLFTYDKGYYKYDSSQNFATLVGSENNDFIVYEKAATDKKNEDVARFMPFNDVAEQDGVVNVVGSQDFYFGMHIGFDMLQPADGKVDNDPMVFKFNGDDDLWVYIDGVLVLDLGGIHGAVDGSINFATGQVLAGSENGTGIYLDENNKTVKWENEYTHQAESWNQDTTIKALMQAADSSILESEFDGNTFTDWSNHRVDIFYLERGAGESNCKMEFNIQTLPTGSLTVSKATKNIDEDYNYKFKLTDESENPVSGAKYKVYGEDADSAQELYTDSDGIFTLKSDQYAVFSELSPNATYTVTEVNGDRYSVSDFNVTVNDELVTDGNYSGTVTITPASASALSFVNINSQATPLAAGEPVPGYSKKAVNNNAKDGIYDLSLSVTGSATFSTSNPPINVLFVVDQSRSMDANKRNQISNAVDVLMRQLSAYDAQYALVNFGGTYYYETPFDDAAIAVPWGKDQNSIKSGITQANSKLYGDYTNYEAGIQTAIQAFKSLTTSDNAETVVIFMSDGNPTAHYDDSGDTDRNGAGGVRDEDINAAKEAIKLLPDTVDYFYTVGVGSDNYDYLDVMLQAKPDYVEGKHFNGTDANSMNGAFSQIAQEITYKAFSNVSINDTLSQYVDVVMTGEGEDQKPDGFYIKVTKKGTADDGVTSQDVIVADESDNEHTEDGNTATVELNETSMNANGVTITATYSPATKHITMSFSDPAYKLENGWTYEVHINIQANDDAKKAYLRNNFSYANIKNDDGTPATTNQAVAGTGTHGGTDDWGFYSNTEAELTYTNPDNENRKVTYDNPIVQLKTKTVGIVKEFEGLPNETVNGVTTVDTPAGFTVNVNWTDTESEDPTTNTHKFVLDSNNTKSVENANAKWTWSVQLPVGVSYDLTESAYAVTTNKKLSTVSVQVDSNTATSANVPSNTSESIPLTTLDMTNTESLPSSVAITNTYTDSVGTLQIIKEIEGNPLGNGKDVFIFKIQKDETCPVWYMQANGAGNAIYYDAEGRVVTQLTLPAGEYTVEELDNINYDANETQYKVDDEEFANGFSATVDVDGDGAIVTFKNSPRDDGRFTDGGGVINVFKESSLDEGTINFEQKPIESKTVENSGSDGSEAQ